MRRPVYVLPDRPWWVDFGQSLVLALVAVVAMMLAGLFFAGCGDNIAPPAADAGLVDATCAVACRQELSAPPDPPPATLIDVACAERCEVER